MLDDGTLIEIAASFKVASAGRLGAWRERMDQDRPLIDSVRALTPVATGLQQRDPQGIGTTRMDAAAGPHSWDRRTGESCTDRVEQALARIQAHPELNAFTHIFPEQALAQARALDARLSRGETIGPFAGAIVAVKDIMAVQETPISGATAAYQTTPRDDSLVVARLRAAGGIIIGTANLHALAYGPFSTSSDFGPVRNPLNTAVVAGGSSGGSAAAVAAGLADIAVGTDTAGSIRMPAALCGIVGVKPSYSLVPTEGAQPLAASLDHIGPLARTVADAHAALNAMLGIDGNAAAAGQHGPSQQQQAAVPLAGVTIGLADAYVDPLLAPPIRQAFEAAKTLVQALGARLTSVRLPTLAAAPGIILCILGPEAFNTFKDLLEHRASLLPDDVRLRLEAGMFITEPDYAHSQRLRADLRAEIDTAFGEVDLIMTPTMAVQAPLLREVDGTAWRGAMNLLTMPFNLTGNPALTLPMTRDDRGAGIGMQFIGARYADSRLLTLAAVIEAKIGLPLTLQEDTPWTVCTITS